MKSTIAGAANLSSQFADQGRHFNEPFMERQHRLEPIKSVIEEFA
jgi:hypothetical protein